MNNNKNDEAALLGIFAKASYITIGNTEWAPANDLRWYFPFPIQFDIKSKLWVAFHEKLGRSE